MPSISHVEIAAKMRCLPQESRIWQDKLGREGIRLIFQALIIKAVALFARY
jgi:hypothetical protein